MISLRGMDLTWRTVAALGACALSMLLVAAGYMALGRPLMADEPAAPRGRWRPKSEVDEPERRPVPSRPATLTTESDEEEEDDYPEPTKVRPVSTTGSSSGPPKEAGQLLQEYDIRGYADRFPDLERPEQPIIDWILRETGMEVWHRAPSGYLTGAPDKISVYHTPAMQAVVADVVDRFTTPDNADYAFAVRVITVDNPNWRAKAHRLLRPMQVETQGIGAWLVGHEDAMLLLSELQRRSDFREHSSPNMLVYNGESTVVTATRPRTFIRGVTAAQNGGAGFDTDTGQIDEGFKLELAPLLSHDGELVDAVVKCNIDQVEKLRSVTIDVPTASAPRQRANIEIPQVSHCRVHERFRWPSGQVLIVGLGMVAPPTPAPKGPLRLPIAGLGGEPPRADLLLVIENRGKIAPHKTPTKTARKPGGGERRPR